MVNSLGRTASEPAPAPDPAPGAGAAEGAAEGVGEAGITEVEKEDGAALGEATGACPPAWFSGLVAAGEGVGVGEGAAEEGLAAGVLGAAALPSPILVVSSPSSMYTPLKNQSSAPAASLAPGSLRIPTWKSAPLDCVLAVKGPAVFFSSSLPVECQKVTEPPEKSIS